MDRWMDKGSLPGLTVSCHEKLKWISIFGQDSHGWWLRVDCYDSSASEIQRVTGGLGTNKEIL